MDRFVPPQLVQLVDAQGIEQLRPSDGPARLYLARCDEFTRTGIHHGTGETDRKLVWLPEYDIGVPDIDDQHHEWCARLNSLGALLHDGNMAQITGTDRHLGRFPRDVAPDMAVRHG